MVRGAAADVSASWRRGKDTHMTYPTNPVPLPVMLCPANESRQLDRSHRTASGLPHQQIPILLLPLEVLYTFGQRSCSRGRLNSILKQWKVAALRLLGDDMQRLHAQRLHHQIIRNPALRAGLKIHVPFLSKLALARHQLTCKCGSALAFWLAAPTPFLIVGWQLKSPLRVTVRKRTIAFCNTRG